MLLRVPDEAGRRGDLSPVKADTTVRTNLLDGADVARGSLRLAIAGIRIDLAWDGASRCSDLDHVFYQAFCPNGQTPRADEPTVVRLCLHCGPLPASPRADLLFDAATANRWRLWRQDGHYLFEFFDTKPPHQRVQCALMAPDFGSGELYRRPDETSPEHAWSLVQLMRPFGELLLISLLSQGRGVLVHALGVNDRGQGLLFVGRSGAGKSTLGKLYLAHSDVTILGDERLVVTQAGGQFWLSGTPWPGDAFTTSPETVPLRRVFFLEHGRTNRLIADSFMNLYGLFFQQVFLPFWDGQALAFAMRFSEEVLRALPAKRLSFVNDASVVEFLRDVEG